MSFDAARRWGVPVLAAGAVALVALVAVAVGGADRGDREQPAPQASETITDEPTDDRSDALLDEVPTVPTTVPHLIDGVVHAGERSFAGYLSVSGTQQGWVAVSPPFEWSWSNGGVPRPLAVPLVQPPVVSPDGRYVAYISVEGEMNGFETAPDGEGMGLPVSVAVHDDDGVGTRIGAVTDDGWVVASGRGVGVLWRPFDGVDPVDLTETAPGQLVWQGTRAGLVVVDGSGDARDPSGDVRDPDRDGRVYLADLTPEGELVPLADLPYFGIADVSEEWVAWVPAEQVGGEVPELAEIRVRSLEGDREGVLSAPSGWRFENSQFTFEDSQFLVARVTDGDQQRMARCSPALQECVLADLS